GLYVISELHWFRGNFSDAGKHSLRSAEVGRAADPATTARTLGHSGRCLAMLGQQMDRAWNLLHEATDLAEEVGLELPDIALGMGILHHHLGQYEEAVRALTKAHDGAARLLDHWVDWECCARLALVELERRRPSDALAYCTTLSALAEKMGEGSEPAVTETL